MKIKEILLSSTISTIVTLAAVYIFENYFKPEPEAKTDQIVPELMPIPAEKKKKIFDRMQSLKDTAVKKKLLDEIKKRDVTVTINFWKGVKQYETN